MAIDRKYFFDNIKKAPLFSKGLTTKQVEGCNAILDRWEANPPSNDLRWLAYMLATAFHETAFTMQPVAEYGKGRGRKYGIPHKNGKTYYGRGYVQLTWFENYQTMSRLLGIDLVNNPDLAMDPKVAAEIMFEGMTKGASARGDFTGVSLETYFNGAKEDWIMARKIINGLDKAQKIAREGQAFFAALRDTGKELPKKTAEKVAEAVVATEAKFDKEVNAASGLRLRVQPNTLATTLQILDNGTKLRILSADRADWYYVETENRKLGWVSKDFVK